jgi:hypothetical protein
MQPFSVHDINVIISRTALYHQQHKTIRDFCLCRVIGRESVSLIHSFVAFEKKTMTDSHNPLPPDDIPLNDFDVETTIDKTAILRHMMNLLELNPQKEQNLTTPKNETEFFCQSNSLNTTEVMKEVHSPTDSDPFASKIESCTFLWDIRCSFIHLNIVLSSDFLKSEE